jgi:hypothetical protein
MLFDEFPYIYIYIYMIETVEVMWGAAFIEAEFKKRLSSQKQTYYEEVAQGILDDLKVPDVATRQSSIMTSSEKLIRYVVSLIDVKNVGIPLPGVSTTSPASNPTTTTTSSLKPWIMLLRSLRAHARYAAYPPDQVILEKLIDRATWTAEHLLPHLWWNYAAPGLGGVSKARELLSIVKNVIEKDQSERPIAPIQLYTINTKVTDKLLETAITSSLTAIMLDSTHENIKSVHHVKIDDTKSYSVNNGPNYVPVLIAKPAE